MQGKSLFNDGIGIVLFTILLLFATGGVGERTTIVAIGELLLVEAGGGLLLGIITGYLAYWAMRLIDDYAIEVLISLALVTATYAVAQRLHVSGPLAVVAAGLLIGHPGPQDAMSDQTQSYLFGLWTLIDEILNSVLFLLIGLEVLILRFTPNALVIGAVEFRSPLPANIVVGLPALVSWSSRSCAFAACRFLPGPVSGVAFPWRSLCPCPTALPDLQFWRQLTRSSFSASSCRDRRSAMSQGGRSCRGKRTKSKALNRRSL